VGYLPASDPPYSFHWIEFWGIWRQEDTFYPFLICMEEVSQIACFVPSGIVQNKV